jgi:hypothetical protein
MAIPEGMGAKISLVLKQDRSGSPTYSGLAGSSGLARSVGATEVRWQLAIGHLGQRRGWVATW